MSAVKRFYINGAITDRAVLSDGEFLHAAVVMRLREGDEVVLNNGDGMDYFGTVETVGKKSATVRIDRTAKNVCAPRVDVTLFQAVCKGERMELITQKANELGVGRIVPFVSRYTTVSAESHKAERMTKIAIESAKQCGRASAAEIAPITTFEKALNEAAKYDRIIMAYEHATVGSLSDALEGAPQRIALIVGSEGGFSSEEAQLVQDAGARIVTMGSRILRAETAAIALTAAVMCLVGEWTR